MTGGYTASKFAVAGLSQALRIEAAECGVRVSVVCPGVIKTPILNAKGNNISLYEVPQEKADEAWKRTFPADPDRFARATLKQVRKNKAVIIVPGWWKVFWWIGRISPALLLVILKTQFYDVAMKDVGEYIPKRGKDK
jgi:short-subunit dehydrogenase